MVRIPRDNPCRDQYFALLRTNMTRLFIDGQMDEDGNVTKIPDDIGDINAELVHQRVGDLLDEARRASGTEVGEGYDIGDTVVRDQDQETVPPKYRRLDSVARLVLGSGVCTAVVIVDDKIFFAANEDRFDENNLRYVFQMFRYLKLYESSESDAEKEIYFQNAERAFKVMSYTEYREKMVSNPTKVLHLITLLEFLESNQDADITQLKNLVNGVLNIPSNADLKRRLAAAGISERITQDNLKMYIRRQLIGDFQSCHDHYVERGFDRVGADVLKVKSEGERLDFTSGSSRSLYFLPDEVGKHAEMKILDHLFDTGKLKFNERTKKIEVTSHEPIYIGVSKLCCKQCTQYVLAINALSQREMGEDKGILLQGEDKGILLQGEELGSLAVRGSHGLPFSSGYVKPRFAEKYPEIQEKAESIVVKVSERRSQYPPDSISPAKPVSRLHRDAKPISFDISGAEPGASPGSMYSPGPASSPESRAERLKRSPGNDTEATPGR